MIEYGLTKEEADKIEEPKVTVEWQGKFDVYYGEDFDTPPRQPS